MNRVGVLKKRDSDRARNNAKRKNTGRANSKVSPKFKLNLTPQSCECAEKAWDIGDDICGRCGKTI